MTAALPPVLPAVLTDTLDALPARLRRKVDQAAGRALDWPVHTDGGDVVVTVDERTTVRLPADAVVGEGAQVRCSCLLAPNCLHRAAVLARCPAADGPSGDTAGPPEDTADGPSGDTDPAASAATPEPATVEAPPPDERTVTAEQRQAAARLAVPATQVLAAGLAGSGLVVRAGLLRAGYEARALGLHRPAALGREVAALIVAGQTEAPHYRLADLAERLGELLLVCRSLTDPATPGDAVAGLLGTARRPYGLRGSLRLYGLCSVPVVPGSGYGGVITYLVDRDGRPWMIADLMPGGADRAAATGDATVKLGDTALTHRQVARTGLVVTGATASPSGQLGAGAGVRAVSATGAAWHESPLTALWQEPVADQARRAFAALSVPVTERPAGADLMFLRVRVLGRHDDGLRAVTDDGLVITVAPPSDHETLPYRENLRVLAGAPGLPLRLVGAPDPARPARLLAHAVAPDDDAAPDAEAAGADAETAGPRLVLPAGHSGHLDLGYDRLHTSALRGAAGPAGPVSDGGAGAGEPHDAPLRLLRRHVERVVTGGRSAQALARTEPARLRRARLDTGAAVLARLADTAGAHRRDAFGRLALDDGADFTEAWLASFVYQQAAARALIEASWYH